MFVGLLDRLWWTTTAWQWGQLLLLFSISTSRLATVLGGPIPSYRLLLPLGSGSVVHTVTFTHIHSSHRILSGTVYKCIQSSTNSLLQYNVTLLQYFTLCTHTLRPGRSLQSFPDPFPGPSPGPFPAPHPAPERKGGRPRPKKGRGRVCRPSPRGAAARQKEDLITVGFEPTPSRTSALSWRLRPLGQVTSHDRCTSGSFASMTRPPPRGGTRGLWIRLRLQVGLQLRLRLRLRPAK